MTARNPVSWIAMPVLLALLIGQTCAPAADDGTADDGMTGSDGGGSSGGGSSDGGSDDDADDGVVGPPVPGDDGDDDADALTADELAAVSAGVASAAALGQAISTSQSGTTDAGDIQVPDVVTVGTCPIVTTRITGGFQQFELTLDFGSGCAVLGSADYLCAGRATGTVDRTLRQLDLTFAQLTCNEEMLDGSANLTFARSGSTVGLDGEWDLAWRTGDTTISTDGTADTRYDLAASTSEITSFAGSVSDGEGTFFCNMATVLISYVNNASFIPSAGTVVLSRSDVGMVTIVFDADSPATGDVEVTIDDRVTVTVNLFELGDSE